MISWRYHVVSIVAVVLAFGLGILAGTSVVNDRFVEQLQRNYNEAVRERDEARQLVAFYERTIQALEPTLRDETLAGERVIVITMDRVEAPSETAAEELSAAGADVLATLTLTRRLAELDVEENAAALEELLGLAGSDPESLRRHFVEALAGRLAGGAIEEEDDLLGGLLGEGLLTADRDLDSEALLGIGGAGQFVVIAAGGRAPVGLPGPDALLIPLTERLLTLNVPTAEVGPVDDPYGFVAAVRDANEIPDCSTVTIDDIDSALGGITLAMAVDRLLEDADPDLLPGGDYGIKGDSIVPGAGEPPASCRR